jgi:large subunit ribosomal protein L1
MSKRLKNLEKITEPGKLYAIGEAVALLKKSATAKFDETVEVHVRLGIDPKQTDQNVRGVVVLPHGLGKKKRIAVIAKGEKVKEAETAGADFVGFDELVEKIGKGWMDFDVLIATPDVMKDIAKLGKVLGPKGLMPNPKSGTITFDIAKAVKEIQLGRVEFKNDGFGIIHSPAGKASFSETQLKDNIALIINSIIQAKPPTSKGIYIKSLTIASTMGPGIPLDPQQSFS